jgi:predicted site-specific integrase-resolvase
MPNTNGHGPKRAILYARVSTDEQARSGYSIPDQLKELRGHAIREGYQVVEEIEDEGYSGGDPYRPGLQRIMQLAETGEIDIVIAAKRDRFQHLYAEGVIEVEDLRARLSELDAMYAEAQRHRDYFETRRKHLKELERDKEELLASYEILARERLEELSPEKRNGLYRRFNRAVRVPRDGEPKLSADIDLTFSKTAESYLRSSATAPA